MKKVITYGTFDLFHEGHYNLLKRAKELGDYLIVGVTTENYDITRGKLGIVDSTVTRINNVLSTGFVDEVIVEDHSGQKIEDVQKYGIDIFTVGSDWVGRFDYMKEFCEVVYLERTKGVSSSMIRENSRKVVRLGVIGTGRIANRVVPEVRSVSGINIEGAYNPRIISAKRYVDQYQLGFATDNLEELFSRVDAVYIASPHETHYEYAKASINQGKHVLCEKPLCFKKEQAEELYKLAEEKKVVLLEALKTAYCPGFIQMMNVAKSGIIGEIKDVEACFTKLVSKDTRELMDEKYGGAFTELGSYVMLPIMKLLGTDYKNVEFNSIPMDGVIDGYTKMQFIYNNAFATGKVGLQVKSEGQLVIAGTQGYILAESPWWLTRKFEVRFEDQNRREPYSAVFLGDGLRYEISDFVGMINGRTESFKFTSVESIAMAGVMEKFINTRKGEENDGR